MKLKYFYKIDHKKQPIAGSNIRRKSKPAPLSQWKEILDPCCSPLDIDCTCGPRFFVQLDAINKPVDGTLIKRAVFPNMTEGVKYYEIEWKPTCCIVPSTPVTIVNNCGATWNSYKVQFYSSDGLTLLAETEDVLNDDPQLVNVPIVIGGYIIKHKWLSDLFPGVDDGIEVWEGPNVTGTLIIIQNITEGTIPPQTYPSALRPVLVPIYTIACTGGS